MNEVNKKNSFTKNIQVYFVSNIKLISLILIILLTTFVGYQTFTYLKFKELKKISITFFETIDNKENIINNLNALTSDKNFFSLLSKLKLIQKYNQENNFKLSNDLYKDIILKENLEELYRSSIAVVASYTMIEASLKEKKLDLIVNIPVFIENISDNLEGFQSLKKELEYLYLATELEINNSDYFSNPKITELYNIIINSNSISSSVKERVKKIHEFSTYK